MDKPKIRLRKALKTCKSRGEDWKRLGKGRKGAGKGRKGLERAGKGWRGPERAGRGRKAYLARMNHYHLRHICQPYIYVRARAETLTILIAFNTMQQ